MSHSSWSRLTPRALFKSMRDQPDIAAALSNIAWLMGDHVLRTGVRAIVSVWIARYLGPEQFGRMNFVIAFASLFSGFAALGLSAVVVRDLVTQPQCRGEIIGSAFFLQLLGGVISFALLGLSISLTRPGDLALIGMTLLLGSTMLFPVGVVRDWFESQVKYRYVASVENTVFLAMSGVRVLLILGAATLMAFIVTTFVEALLTALGLFAVYVWTRGSALSWRPRIDRAKAQLRDSWPLVVSAFSYTVYSRVDQIMLGRMEGDVSVGIYAAAVRAGELWYFVPAAIVSSLFPSIIASKQRNDGTYETRLQVLCDLMVAVGFVVGIVISLNANLVTTLLFGSAYQSAAPILMIYGWAGLFLGLSWITTKYMLVEGLQRINMYQHLFGAALNVAANWFMIPAYGMAGAAMASILSFAVANYLSDLVHPRTRFLFVKKSRALLFIWLFGWLYTTLCPRAGSSAPLRREEG